MISGHYPERRSIGRTKGTFFIKFRFYHEQSRRLDVNEYDGMTLDISEIGLSLISDKKVPLGTTLFLKFLINNEPGNTLSSHRRIIIFTGHTVYSKVLDDGLYRYGIYFGPAKKETQEKFFDVICSVPPRYHDKLKSRICDVIYQDEEVDVQDRGV